MANLTFASSYCFNVIATNSKTNESVAYVALSVYSSTWYGPSRAGMNEETTVIVVVVCVVFLFAICVAFVIYWLWRKRREQNSFELY